MYAIRNLFDKHPIQLAGAVTAWLNLAVITGWVELSAEAVAGLNGALIITLGLFVATKTANVSVLNAMADTPPTIDGVELALASGPPAKAKRPARKQSGASDAVVLIVVLVIVLLLLGYFGGVR